jgi:hypothetical protein
MKPKIRAICANFDFIRARGWSDGKTQAIWYPEKWGDGVGMSGAGS